MKRIILHVPLAALCLLLTACILVQPAPTPQPTATPMPTITPTPTPTPATPAGFRHFLDEIESVSLADRPFTLNQYWAQIEQTPLVDSSHAVFLYRGNATEVGLGGDMTNHIDTQQIPLERIQGTDLWWTEQAYEADARLDYHLLLGGQRTLDPRNPNTSPSGFGPYSELRMVDYVDPAALTDPTVYPAGTVTEHTIDSVNLGQARTFLVYQPVSRQIGAPPPVLLVQDGADAVNLVDMPRLLDTLIGRREALPLVVAFVPPFDRNTEYWHNDAYADFLANEVLPFVQAEYNTATEPEKTGLLGASLGGLISLHTAIRHPDKFGRIAAQSGAFVADEDSIIKKLAETPPHPFKIHLVVGSYETAVAAESGLFPDPDFYAANQRLAEVLEQQGYDFSYQTFPQGHSWGLWRAQLGAALEYLYR